MIELYHSFSYMNAYELYLLYRLIAAKGLQYMYDYKSCEDCVIFSHAQLLKGKSIRLAF